MSRTLRPVVRVARWLAFAVGALLLVVLLAVAVLQTGWGKERLRRLAVSQANRVLTATLGIGRLEGSLFQGITLRDVTLSRDGQVIVAIDTVTANYSIGELTGAGTSIRSLQVVRPRVVAAKQADGRWNLSALLKPRPPGNGGPGRLFHIRAIEVTDGSVRLLDPLTLGAVQLPSNFSGLNLLMSLDTGNGGWRMDFARASWVGAAPDLLVKQLTGGIGDDRDGWTLAKMHAETARSLFTVDGHIDSAEKGSAIHLAVDAERFAFQEWAGLLSGLRNIAVESRFTTTLEGPRSALATNLTLSSNGGDIRGAFTLDSTSPGWRGKGAVDVTKLDLARWLNRPDRPSDISGHVSFDFTDIGLRVGGRFPRGTYAFDGERAAFVGYQASPLKAHGTLTSTAALIAEATGNAYGAQLHLSGGSIGIDEPYAFKFTGQADGVDLRRVPESVPVPHVESVLGFAFDVDGRFSNPVIRGQAQFDDSTFLGAAVGSGTVGSIDTSVSPLHYSGEGDVNNIDLNRFGTDLEVLWLEDRRYRGLLSGRFRVDGTGTDLATMTLNGGGHIARADLFGGQFTNGETTIAISSGSLSGSYDGQLSTIDPSIAMGDDRYKASLTGTGKASVSVKDLLVRSPELKDYDLTATLAVENSRISSIALDQAQTTSSLSDGTLSITSFHAVGPQVDLDASGALELDGIRSSHISYNLRRGDLSLANDALAREIAGDIATTGELTGPYDELHAIGDAHIGRVESAGVTALTGDLKYDVSIPPERPADAKGSISGTVALVQAFGERLENVSGTVGYDSGRVTPDLHLQVRDLPGSLAGTFRLHPDDRSVDVDALSLMLQRSSWQLAPGTAAHVSWDNQAVAVSGLALVDSGTQQQRIAAEGTLLANNSQLHVTATALSIDALTAGDDGAPAKYGGSADLDFIVSGLPSRPSVSGQLTITDGRVWRVAYDKLAGRLTYSPDGIDVDLRLDQGPGVWLTAAGRIPVGLVDKSRPEEPFKLALASSAIDLALVEGLTSVVHDLTGKMTLNVTVVGTTHDPHFDGRLEIADAGFVAQASGARYQHGRVALSLASDRVTVDAFHLEDANGDPLDASGSLGTHELRVGDLQLTVNARAFEVLRNEYGRLDINARVELSGMFEAPILTGRITVASGELNADAILDRTMLQSFVAQQDTAPELDAVKVLNPWDRLSMDLELNVPNTLRLVGDNVQLSPGTPLGLGDINLRALGDLYLYKGPSAPLYVTGSLDSVTGTYAFQGRRFDLDPNSSINFRGDFTPDVYVTVTRDIAGVETRVTIAGLLNEPELRLSSNPPLESSDILSLIVFNTQTNQLSSLQQQQLAVRAGTLAAGFLAAPMVGALERSLGLDTLEIESGDMGTGARVTIGNEIAPGLFARFSRQFGQDEYDAATIEYVLSRILRIRATFSDAGVTRSPFRRVERAGVDLLVFFSF